MSEDRIKSAIEDNVRALMGNTIPRDVWKNWYEGNGGMGATDSLLALGDTTIIHNHATFAFESIFDLETQFLLWAAYNTNTYPTLRGQRGIIERRAMLLRQFSDAFDEIRGNRIIQNAEFVSTILSDAEDAPKGLSSSIPTILQALSRNTYSQADKNFNNNNVAELIEILTHLWQQLDPDASLAFRSPRNYSSQVYDILSRGMNREDKNILRDEYQPAIFNEFKLRFKGRNAALDHLLESSLYRTHELDPYQSFRYWARDRITAELQWTDGTRLILAPSDTIIPFIRNIAGEIIYPLTPHIHIPLLHDVCYLISEDRQQLESFSAGQTQYLHENAQRLATMAACLTLLMSTIPTRQGVFKPTWVASGMTGIFTKFLLFIYGA